MPVNRSCQRTPSEVKSTTCFVLRPEADLDSARFGVTIAGASAAALWRKARLFIELELDPGSDLAGATPAQIRASGRCNPAESAIGDVRHRIRQIDVV